MDTLTHMLALQLDMQRRYGYDFAAMSDRERIQFVKDMHIAAVRELYEALDEVSWKPWTTGERFNTLPFISELSDAWQFVANMWFAAMPAATPQEVAQAMLTTLETKLLINEARRVSGYDGVSTKCVECRRALDDAAVSCWAATETKLGFCALENLHIAFVLQSAT